MAGLYIHIPFCKSRCIYCGFYSTVRTEWRQRYVDAVCREMTLRQPTANGQQPAAERIDTIYLGGGTPSQLTVAQLQQLFLYINKVYAPTPSEVTIECNPDDITVPYAVALSQLPVNRVSMGAQTFDDQRLRFLHRRHTASQVPVAVRRLRDAGIGNISIDLMYGFPGETLDDWQRDVDAALALNVEHLSAYCLTIEEGTPLWRLKMKDERLKIKDDRLKMPDEELELKMYETLIDRLTTAGYEHYEISNFARPGRRSRHNSSYWQDVPYIGLGAAAHSYATTPAVRSCATTPATRSCAPTPAVRSWNVSDIQQYMASIERGELPCEREVIDDDTHYNDRITTALRTCEGLDLSTLSDRHRRYCLHEAQRALDDGLLRLTDNRLVLTRQGLFVSDMVMSALMLV